MNKCLDCVDKKNCPMNEMLVSWEKVKEECGTEIPDHTSDEFYIDAPEKKKGVVVWCPMYSKE